MISLWSSSDNDASFEKNTVCPEMFYGYDVENKLIILREKISRVIAR